MYRFVIVSFVFTVFSCNPDEQLRKELDTAVFKIDMLQNQLNNKSAIERDKLVHIVFLNLKDELSEKEVAELITSFKQVQSIEEIDQFSIGDFENMADDRAMSNYELCLQMVFNSKDDYNSYQTDSLRLALKKSLDEYLEAPPVTYDYFVN